MGSFEDRQRAIQSSYRNPDPENLWTHVPLIEEKNATCVGKSCVTVTNNTVKSHVYRSFPDYRTTARFRGLHIGSSNPRQFNASRFSDNHSRFREVINNGTVLRFWRDVPSFHVRAPETYRGFVDFSVRRYIGSKPKEGAFVLPYNQYLVIDAGFEF